jgi:hypothetical protein
MDWKQLLASEIEMMYKRTEGLMDQVDDSMLAWKPSPDNNWMSYGQLLRHLSDACGMAMKGFVTGDWGLPEGMNFEDIPPEDMLPPAEKMPAVTTVQEAKTLLAQDKQTALEMLEQTTNEELENKIMAAPWAPAFKQPLGQHLLQMIYHLDQHKNQLFFYLKLYGKPVNTHTLYAM